jgi:ubiquinone/menaquinone biosynthesis C-methylase UbiE
MSETQRIYLPAVGHRWLLPLYDPLTRFMGVNKAHGRLIEQAHIHSNNRILEIGCGTGNLAIRIKQIYPRAQVVGLDPDLRALARARQKAEKNGLDIEFTPGFADALPYPDGSFDRVLSALMFHHLLKLEGGLRTLGEARRVLAPGGALHLVDFGRFAGEPGGSFLRLLHRSERLRDNMGNRIPMLMKDAGFAESVECGYQELGIFGRVTYYRACLSDAARPLENNPAPAGIKFNMG